MIPGSEPNPKPMQEECITCRVMGFGVLTGTGLYTIYSSLYASDPHPPSPSSSSAPTPPASSPSPNATSPNGNVNAVAKQNLAPKPTTVAGHSIPLGLNKGPQFGGSSRAGRGIMAGFGVLLVAAGIARGFGVTHYDVINAKNRILGTTPTILTSEPSTSATAAVGGKDGRRDVS